MSPLFAADAVTKSRGDEDLDLEDCWAQRQAFRQR
jgi:hypothetical protein